MKLKYGPYSPSRLETAICGFSFYRQYVEPIEKGTPRPKIENLPQARGSALHEVLEIIERLQVARPDAVINESMVRTWVAEAIERHPAAYEETDVILQMVKKYVRKPIELPADAGIELRMAVKLADLSDAFAGDAPVFVECDYEDPDAIGRGRADITTMSEDTTTAKIIDHKTFLNMEEKADTFQMGFYAWVMWKTYPFLQNIVTQLHFARFGTFSDEHVWTVPELQKIEDELLTRIQIIENRKEWIATPHKGCQYCPYLAECPVMKDVIEIRPNGSAIAKINSFAILGSPDGKIEKARWVASVVHAIETIRDDALDNLKAYIKDIGMEVSIPGISFHFKTSEGVDWDRVNKKHKEQMCEIFERHHIDPKRFMVFSSTSTKPLPMLENQALLTEIHKILPRNVSTRFGSYKV